MILKETLKEIAVSQRKELSLFEYGVEREKLKEINIEIPFAIILSGIRRCGKSTLSRQIAKKLENFYYFNFEDPRIINLEIQDFHKLDQVFIEEFGKSRYYFFDEIQNAPKWELFIRALLDKKKYVVITGSNASLLSKELGTRLTGRHLRYELFPFSFIEFLSLLGKKPNIESFEEYLIRGGFPEYLKVGRAEILQELMNDIIARDIIARYNIRNVKTIKEMALYLLTNVGKELSYNNLKKIFNLGSTNTAISFVSYFENSYLLFIVPKFDYSLKKQLVNPKKVYSIDNGLTNVNSVSFSGDRGRMLENVVFLALRRKHKNIFYFQKKKECDFVVKEGTEIVKAVQVCYELNEDNKNREVEGLIEAMEEFQLQKGLILTYAQEDELRVKNKKIKILPVWKWLLL
jgi:predicted AAA+ superfamily ATPase